MVFPAAAILFIAWFFLTPVIRIVLWIFGRRLGLWTRFLITHGSAYVIAVAATAIVLSGPETAGMAVIFAIGQVVFLLMDFWRIRTGEHYPSSGRQQRAPENL
jgi:hypothetical protein